MRSEIIKTEVTVIGGGLAGVCAAIAAARMGQRVSLVQNRPVLGGNSSSEVRVWVCGATGHGVNRYARETGIMGELFVENQYRNPDGNPYLWDLIVLEAVKAEKNIELFLNTDVHEVEATGSEVDRQIHSVTGWMMGSERKIRFESKMFLDCTGDGLVGFLAGAKFRIGREAHHEFKEDWAPEAADDITLGSTILFYTKDAGQPVKYIPPSFAKDISQTSIPVRRVMRSGDSGCHYWWIEWGGELDTVHENERIRDELWSVIYGIWDYIKNSGKFEADNMTLEWVGSLPGKREYRRFVGDYILNQNDIVAQEQFEDRVAFGGWSIDLHPPKGMYAEESGSKHFHADGTYHIPFRSLYSSNVNNLLFAGRNVSATHVAFGTTRVMATCAVMGEAAGTGAALSAMKGITPRELSQSHLAELQQTLLRQDASIIGIRNEDAGDLGRSAQAAASSTMRDVHIDDASKVYSLLNPVGITFPVTSELNKLSLLVDALANTEMTIEIHSTGKKENYIPMGLISKHTVKVTQGTKQWVDFALDYKAEEAINLFVVIQSNPELQLYTSETPLYGVLCFENKIDSSADFSSFLDTQQTMAWQMKGLHRTPFCFKAFPETTAYEAVSAIDGYTRPFGGPHTWVSNRMDSNKPEWLSLEWDSSVSISNIHITFNDDVNEDLINLHHHRTPFEVIPELVKDYRIEAFVDEQWKVLLRETDNRKRKRTHQLEPIRTNKIRVVIEATNGCPYAEVVEIRAYE
ncbi:pyridine nucleotide-disulfide oxidoreductase [Paenibacillus sp. FSL A5-0031]|uniref:FAD-dependent oxidoreductase n=1 Tax=Paenibacillus sp. FSL A5-0031 TaxID=1920420 RepID=UPI00096C7FBE|nr:FAD-dependent oxidoreductase [Paenibacillus sp. FSL A5-0031]OME87318.1 pyridine nucleotide-disulfide oxidoreductase [Paenibacillus sp. FSL A5-0031]